MAKNDATLVSTRLSTKSLRRAVDYAQHIDSLSPEDQQRIHDGINGFLSLAKPLSPTGLMYRWKDRRSSAIDKVIAASLAMWYALPGNSYRVTINFDHKYKESDFEYLRDELTRLISKHRIKYFWFSFEVSRSGRLHCHGMINTPDHLKLDTLRNSLQDRFGKSDEIKNSLRGKNKIVHIDPVVYAPHEGKGPEFWASYAMGDAKFTKPLTGWGDTHYISRALIAPAKAIYDWLRNPDIDRLLFNPDAAPEITKHNWFAIEASYETKTDDNGGEVPFWFAGTSEPDPSPEEIALDDEVEAGFADLIASENEKSQPEDIGVVLVTFLQSLSNGNSSA